MTDRSKTDPSTQTSHRDIQFLAQQAAEHASSASPVPEKEAAFMVLLTALTSASSRLNQHHDQERAELLASIRR